MPTKVRAVLAMNDGGFVGGTKMRQHLSNIAANLASAREVRVGFLENSTYPGTGTSVPMVAAIQEFGAPGAGIPPRPFFRNTIAAHGPKWGEQLGKILASNGYNAAGALGLMGDGIVAQIQASIKEMTSPPLAPATIRAKGFDKPLIDTSVMWNSVKAQVIP
jgi:hypothetical protein